MSNSLKMTLGYEGTDFTRNFTIANVGDDDLTTVKTKIKALNASVAGGTDNGLSAFLRSDDFDSTEGIGTFSGITAAKIVSTEVEYIDLNEEEGE